MEEEYILIICKYTEVITVYGCSFKTRDDQRLAADFSLGEKLPGHIHCLKKETSNMPSLPIRPRTITNYDE